MNLGLSATNTKITEIVGGRNDDMVVVRGLNLFPTMVAAVINKFKELSGEYRIVLDHPPPYDFLPVQAELKEAQALGEDIGPYVEQAIKSKLGATARVTILPKASFPVTEAKTNRVVRVYK